MRLAMFKQELCDNCGNCLELCPVLRLSPELAREYIGRLIEGEHVNEVLDRCTGCMSCDAVRPAGNV